MAKTPESQSYRETAYKALKKAVIACELKPGEVVNERKLAAGLAMSRTPVREALHALRDEGWVTIVPWKGAYIRPVTYSDINECMHLRLAIEPYAVELAAPHIGDKELAYCESLMEWQKSLAGREDASEFITIDQNFHLYFAELTKNGRLISILRTLRDIHLRLGVEAVRLKQRYSMTLREHMAIVAALREGDGRAAAQAMREHLVLTRKALLEIFATSTKENGTP